MKKSFLIASAFSFSVLTMNGFAHANEDHQNTSKEKHEEHASAVGKPGTVAKVSRTVEVDMSDAMKFTPASISVKKGETIKFVVKNSGKIKHEMVLGSIKDLKEHAAMMKKMPEMEHADENMVSVEPGKTGELVWQFTKTGKFDFACLQPGHFEAGMHGKVIVK